MYGTQKAVFGLTMNTTYVALSGFTAGATTFSATPVGTAAAIGYCINGKAYTKAAISGGASPTTDAITGAAFKPLAANQECVFVIGLNAAGTILVAQGNIQPLDPSGNPTQGESEFPFLPDTMCPIGYVVCKNGSTGTAWTYGTSNFNATGMTAAAVPVMTLPARPQAS